MTENDLISREAVLKENARWKDYLDEDMIQRIQAGIKRLPAQGRKTGRWIKMSDADGTYYCRSECGEELYREWTYDAQFDLFPRRTSIAKTKYCPNCGAKMEWSGEE